MTRVNQSAVSLLGWMLVIASSIGCPALARAGRLPYTITSSSGPTGLFVVPVDANNDGVDELLRASSYQTTMLTQNGQYVWDRKTTFGLMKYSFSAFPTDTTSKGYRLVVVPSRDIRGPFVDSLVLHVMRADSGDDDRPGYDRYYWTVRVDSIAHEQRRDSSRGVTTVVFHDINGAGQQEAFVGVASGYGLQPRGVYAVDLVARKVLWRYLTGFNPYNIAVADADGDGQDELVVSGTAPGNGGTGNGMSDDTNYVLCLGRDGRQRWVVPLRYVGSGGQVLVGVADLNGDGKKEVVAVDHCVLTGSAPDRLLVLDGSSGRLLDSVTADTVGDPRFLSLTVADFNGDGKSEIVVTRPKGRIESRDGKLHVTHETSLKGEITLIRAIRLLATGGEQLVTVSTYANTVSVLDKNMWLLAEYTPQQPPDEVQEISQGKGKPGKLLVGLANPPGSPEPQRQFIVLTLEPTPKPFPWPRVCIVLGGLFLAAVGAAVYANRLRQRQVRHLVARACANAAVLRIDRHRRIVEANSSTKGLRPFSGGLRGEDVNKLLGEEEYASLRDAIRSVVAGETTEVERRVAIEDKDGDRDSYLARVTPLPGGGAVVVFENLSTTEQSRRNAMWTTVVQRLAHSIKTPLATIRGAAQLLAGSDKSDLGRKIRIEAERLGAMVDGIMRLTSVEQVTLADKDAGSIIRRTLEEQGVYSQNSVDVAVQVDTALPTVRVDEESLVIALGNVIRNAVEAMPQGGKLSVSASLTDRSGFVRILVADTGPGVSEEQRAKLFQPFFTRKAGGTGLGLALARKTLQDMGGDISIAPPSGTGAVFWLDVPTAESPTT